MWRSIKTGVRRQESGVWPFCLLCALCVLYGDVFAQRTQQFAVFSPVLGLREDVPAITLGEAFTADNQNVHLRYGEIHSALMRAEVLNGVQDPNSNAYLHYHWFEKSDGNDYLLGFTADHALWWNNSLGVWDTVFTCSASASAWSVVTFNDAVYATNNIDKIQTWSGSGNFAAADTASGLEVTTGPSTYLTKAKWLAAFENYLIAGNVTVAGTAYPQALYWCDTLDPADWSSGNAGDMTLDGPDPLGTAVQLQDYLMIFSARSIDVIWAVPSTLIFNSRRLNSSLGTYAPGSIVRDEAERIYFLDNQKNIRAVQSVMAGTPIISAAVDKTLKLIPDSLVSGIQSTYIAEYNQLWWSVPYGPDATANNRILVLDNEGTWTVRIVAASAFGEYENKTTWTIDTIPFDTIDDIGWETIDTVEGNANYRQDIVGDYSGFTWLAHGAVTDAGAASTAYAVIATDFTDPKGSPLLDRYKRLQAMTVFVRNEGAGDLTIEAKRDMEFTWQSVGSVSLAGSGEILWQRLAADLRARHYQFKISSTDKFRFIGMICYFVQE